MANVTTTSVPRTSSLAPPEVHERPPKLTTQSSVDRHVAGVKIETDRFAFALAKVASTFAASPDTIDRQFEPALLEFGEALGMERAAIHLIGKNDAYRWSKSSAAGESGNLGEFSYTSKAIKKRGFLAFSHPEELPLSAWEAVTSRNAQGQAGACFCVVTRRASVK